MSTITIRKALAALLIPVLCFAQSNDDEARAVATLAAVVVTGEQPGPGLWKVTKGSHTLWILGIYSPLPKRFTWRSATVEALIAQSQEIIDAGSVRFDFKSGFFKQVKAIPAVMRAQKIPDDGELSGVLDVETYAKWRSLKEKYIGRSKRVDKLRPTFAVRELQKDALKDEGLTIDSDAIGSVLKKAAKKYKVKTTGTSIDFTVKLDDPAALFNNIAKLHLNDLDCFTHSIDDFESNLQSMKARANAWALGDIEALVALNRSMPQQECGEVLVAAMMTANDQASASSAQLTMEQVKRNFDNARARTARLWIDAAEKALVNNTTTFAVLPIYDLVNPKGRLSLLRDKGLTITAPSNAP